MKRAGARNLSVFDEGAIKAIYKYSKGIPRVINILCDNALLTGFSREEDRIGKSIIQEVIKDLEGSQTIKKSKLLPILLIMIILLLCAWVIITLLFPENSEIWNYLRIFKA
jgi:general secretion pathway protein A